MSCAMIYWGHHYDRFFEVFIQYGAVVNIEYLYKHTIGYANENGNSKSTRKVAHTVIGRRQTTTQTLKQAPKAEPTKPDQMVFDML